MACGLNILPCEHLTMPTHSLRMMREKIHKDYTRRKATHILREKISGDSSHSQYTATPIWRTPDQQL